MSSDIFRTTTRAMITRDWLTMTTLAFVAAFQGVMVTVTNVVKVDIDGLTITLYFTSSLMQSNDDSDVNEDS